LPSARARRFPHQVQAGVGEVRARGRLRQDHARLRDEQGKYVEFESGELDALAPTATKTIEIEDFVPLPDVDPIYFDRTYHLEPSGDGAAHSYALLAAVMDERERVGIGTIVIRERQHLAAIRPYGKGLALTTLHFADEIVEQGDIDGIP